MKTICSRMTILLVAAFVLAVFGSAYAASITHVSYTIYPGAHSAFPDSGGNQLADGIVPSVDFMDGGWVGAYGWSTEPWLSLSFDFGQPETISEITFYILNDSLDGIAPVETFTVSYGDNGTSWGNTENFVTTTAEQTGVPKIVMPVTRSLTGQTARYLQLRLDSVGTDSAMPFLFVGEVTFKTAAQPGSLSGTAVLSGYNDSNDAVRRLGAPVVVEFLQNGSSVGVYRADLGSNGSFSLADAPAGTFDLAFSAAQFLRKIVPGVTISEGANTAIADPVVLVNGDLNGDNFVSEPDYGILSNNWYAFGDF